MDAITKIYLKTQFKKTNKQRIFDREKADQWLSGKSGSVDCQHKQENILE